MPYLQTKQDNGFIPGIIIYKVWICVDESVDSGQHDPVSFQSCDMKPLKHKVCTFMHRLGQHKTHVIP